MTPRRLPVIGVAGMVIGMALMVWFASRGSTVAADGTLVEQFWAWASGVWLFVAGAVAYLADWVWQAVKRRRDQ